MRDLEEAAKLQRHVTEIDRLIVEGTLRQLIEGKDDMAKGKISQKQRKQLEKEKAKKPADQLGGDKLKGGGRNGEDVQS